MSTELDDLLSHVAEIIEKDERRKIEAAERQRCIEDVCPFCAGKSRAHDIAPARVAQGFYRHRLAPGAFFVGDVACKASAIHERIARENSE